MTMSFIELSLFRHVMAAARQQAGHSGSIVAEIKFNLPAFTAEEFNEWACATNISP